MSGEHVKSITFMEYTDVLLTKDEYTRIILLRLLPFLPLVWPKSKISLFLGGFLPTNSPSHPVKGRMTLMKFGVEVVQDVERGRCRSTAIKSIFFQCFISRCDFCA